MNRSCFAVLAARLARTRRPVYALNVPSYASLEKLGSRLAYFVEDVVRETGSSRVDLIGYSWGGVISRYYVERLSGAARVGRVITIASPHRGSRTASFAVTANAAEMLPGSEQLADLQAAGLSKDVEYTSIYSHFDAFVLPPDNAKLPAPARNVEIPDVGHAGVLFSRAVADEVLQALGAHRPLEKAEKWPDRSTIKASS